MKKWFFRGLILLLTIGIAGTSYIFEKYGLLITKHIDLTVIEEEKMVSDTTFAQTIETYVGKENAAKVEIVLSQVPKGSVLGENKPVLQVKQAGISVKVEASAIASQPLAEVKVKEAEKKNIQSQSAASNDIIIAHLEELAKVKGRYNQLAVDLIDQAKVEFYALSPEERTTNNKIKIGLKYMNQALSFENEADVEIYRLIKELEINLKGSGMEDQIAKEIKAYYEEQKELNRQYYITQLTN
jgi:hypothetical protein